MEGAGSDHEASGGAFRRLLRAEMLAALRPAKAAAGAGDLELKLRQSFDQVLMVKQLGSDTGIQTDHKVVEPRDLDLTPHVSPAATSSPAELAPAPRRSLVLEDESRFAENLRTQVQDTRRRLFQKDGEVTCITRELKQCRSCLWNIQREQSAAETQLAKIVRARIGELPAEVHDEELLLDRKERQLAQELSEARANAARWWSIAKRQDAMLQQEREAQGGGDAHRILARHPAGVIFLQAEHTDSDSEDGFDADDRRYGGRRQVHRGQVQESVSLGSSDEDDGEYYARPAPRPPQQNQRPVDSDNEELTAQSAAEEEQVDQPRRTGQVQRAGATSDDSTSEEDTEPGPRQGLVSPMLQLVGISGSIGGATTADPGATPANDDGVDKAERAALSAPPAAGNGTRGRNVPEDEAEEVSSEDIEMESSRSV